MVNQLTNIDFLSIDHLVPHPKNPNRHSEEQIKRIAKVIEHNGWRHPIIVSKLSNKVIVGHGRLEAAKLLNCAKVPVMYQAFKDEDEEYQWMVADNALNQSWDGLDLSKINLEIPNIGPIDIELLGIRDFVVEPMELYTEEKKDEDYDPEPPEEPEKLIGEIQIVNSDCLIALKQLPNNSLDSVVTDPPYGFAFMGKKWDYDIPSQEIWKEIYRTLKPGGHLLAFGGPRTYHRLACGVEDAGFEIRDQLQWLFGSGFPKSLDISKAIDKAAGIEVQSGDGRFITNDEGGKSNGGSKFRSDHEEYQEPVHVTPEAIQWDGWGTALKPANEPILLARKPLSEKTVAANVLKWGTGGLNIDGCRVAGASVTTIQGQSSRQGEVYGVDQRKQREFQSHAEGRFPANLILDETAAEMLDEQSGISKTPKSVTRNERKDTGGASRFFYVAKASKGERNTHCGELEEQPVRNKMSGVGSDVRTYDGKPVAEHKNIHPTVKPVSLMRYLCKLITPPNGIVLDPFMGSGSTGVAALQLGLKFLGMEREAEYFAICEKRLNAKKNQTIVIGKTAVKQ